MNEVSRQVPDGTGGTFTEVYADKALAARIESGGPTQFRVIEDEWTMTDPPVRIIKRAEIIELIVE